MRTLQQRIQKILLIALFIVMTGFVVYIVMIQNDRDKYDEQLVIDSTLELFDQKIDDFHHLSVTSLEMFMNDAYVSHLGDEGVTGENIVDAIHSYGELFDDSYSIALATLEGEMFTRKSIQLPEGYDPRTRDWYIDAMKEQDTIILSQPYESANEPGVFIITYSKTVDYHDDETIIGVAGVNVGLKNIFDFTDATKVEKKGFIALASEEGKVLTDNIHDVLYSQQISIEFDEMVRDEGHSTIDIDGKVYNIHFKQNEKTRWWSVIFIPQLSFWEAYQSTVIVTVLVMILGIICIQLVSWLISYKMTHSINLIVTQVEGLDVLDKKTSIEYEETGMRDIEVLAKGINQLLTRVFDLRDSLTEKQQEITHQYTEIEALYEETAAMNETLNDTVDQLQDSWYQTIRVLSNAIEASDKYTKGHCDRVATLSVLIAKEHGFTSNKVKIIELAALLHDVGKVGIPDRILNKNGRLTAEEYERVKEHSLTGFKIIQDVPFLAEAAKIILHHHERIDGNGYPDGLKGDEMILEAKILAVVDAYDAMTSVRAYRQIPKTSQEAINELEKHSDTQFDSYVISLLKKVIE